jgi:hypothetical protein
MKRDKNDAKWNEVKATVYERDHNGCRLLRVLNPVEAIQLINEAQAFIHRVDPAHIFPVSTDPQLCYDPNNIVCLNRYSHSNLENLRHPITGVAITKEEEMQWWIRIIGQERFDLLVQKRHECYIIETEEKDDE